MALPIKPTPIKPTSSPKTVSFASTLSEVVDNNLLLLYGASGTGKTRECEAVARYVWDKWRKKTRYITVDGGGYQPLKPLIAAGMVQVCDLSRAPDNIVSGLKGLNLGIWPEDGQWKQPKDQCDRDQIGCYIMESVSEYSAYVVQHFLKNNTAASESLVSYTNIPNEDHELAALMGQEKFGAISRSHYGMLATELGKFVRGFRSLSSVFDLKIQVLTTHDASNETEKAKIKQQVLGPGTEGQKFSGIFQRLVGDMIYLCTTTSSKGVEYRAAFTPYPDPQLGNKLWPARIRGNADVTSKLLKTPGLEAGYIVLTDESEPLKREGITKILRRRDQIETEATQQLQAIMESK